MNIADTPAFPMAISGPLGVEFQTGMTYHQWLVGMAMQGIIARTESYGAGLTAMRAIQYADEVCRHLTKTE